MSEDQLLQLNREFSVTSAYLQHATLAHYRQCGALWAALREMFMRKKGLNPADVVPPEHSKEWFAYVEANSGYSVNTVRK